MVELIIAAAVNGTCILFSFRQIIRLSPFDHKFPSLPETNFWYGKIRTDIAFKDERNPIRFSMYTKKNILPIIPIQHTAVTCTHFVHIRRLYLISLVGIANNVNCFACNGFRVCRFRKSNFPLLFHILYIMVTAVSILMQRDSVSLPSHLLRCACVRI